MKKISNSFFFLTLCLLLFIGRAEGQSLDVKTLARLFAVAEKETGVPKNLLAAIAAKESSFNPWAINIAGQGYYMRSKDEALLKIKKSGEVNYDLGLMQINSQWLPKFGLDMEEVIEPEVNVLLASIILRDCLQNHEGIVEGISCYHSGNGTDGLNYAKQVAIGWSELRR